MIGRRKLNTGGQVVPNSSNSVVAYGQTHEQYNPATGETGIIYGDSKLKAAALKMVECMLVKLFVKLLKVVKYLVIRLKFPEQIVLSLITQRNLLI